MKRTTIKILALAVALGMVTASAGGAAWFKKIRAPRTEKPEWMKAPRRYKNLPPMSFHSGLLRQDGWSGWKLGDLKLQLARNCRISTEGGVASHLRAGRQATVMGPRIGDTILAWSVRVTEVAVPAPAMDSADLVLRQSETNPNCGEIVRAAD